MAIKKEDNTYLVEPESNTEGVELDSRFFTPNTLIGGAPLTISFETRTNGDDGETTVDRIKAGDPKASISDMAVPSGPSNQFSYTFYANQPNGRASTFYGDRLRIKTRYCGDTVNPVAPELDTTAGTGDSSISGLSLVRTVDVTTAASISGPDAGQSGIVSAKKLEIIISGTGQGSCRLDYCRNHTQKREQAVNGSVFYLDPGSHYTLNISTSDSSYGDYQYPLGRYDFERDGYINHDGYIKIVINSGTRPVGPIGPTPTPHF